MTIAKPSFTSFDFRDSRWNDRISKAITGLVNYSSSAQRLGTWIDGRPIGVITINTGALPNSTSSNTAHGITFNDIIRMDGFATNGTSWIPIPNRDTGTLLDVEISVSATNIILTTSTNMTSYTKSYVTLVYTI